MHAEEFWDGEATVGCRYNQAGGADGVFEGKSAEGARRVMYKRLGRGNKSALGWGMMLSRSRR